MRLAREGLQSHHSVQLMECGDSSPLSFLFPSFSRLALYICFPRSSLLRGEILEFTAEERRAAEQKKSTQRQSAKSQRKQRRAPPTPFDPSARYSGRCPARSPARPCKELVQGKETDRVGMDEPDTKFVRDNIQKMEQFPFDGFVFHATSGKRENFGHGKSGAARSSVATTSSKPLKTSKRHRSAASPTTALRVNVTPAKSDWFDDEDEARVANTGVAAQVAR